MQVIRRGEGWRIQTMGRHIVLHMHGRWAKLFRPMAWEFTHYSDVDLLEHEARVIVSGYYGRLLTTKAKSQCECIPELLARGG